MRLRNPLTILFLSLVSLTGCAEQAHTGPNPLTFQRGQQLLAAGSPKSAIPLLTQTIVSMPDGPEPVALLALAYALDLQHDRAITQAHQVRRTDGSKPGWEMVAIGIAEMSKNRPAEASTTLARIVSDAPKGSTLMQASGQWLLFSLILNRDYARASAVAKCFSHDPNMQTTSLLWSTLLEAEQGHNKAATDFLVQCAKLSTNDSGTRALHGDLVAADDQGRYDAAIAALATGDLDTARKLFEIVRINSPLESDAPVWLALIAGANHDWESCRAGLKDACEHGSTDSCGLANQLFSVVCAIEDRPDDMIDSVLAGQRLVGRNSTPAYIVDQPKPESVWFSDSMK